MSKQNKLTIIYIEYIHLMVSQYCFFYRWYFFGKGPGTYASIGQVSTNEWLLEKNVMSLSYGLRKRYLKCLNLKLGTTKKIKYFSCYFFLMYHFILKLFWKTWYFWLDLYDMIWKRHLRQCIVIGVEDVPKKTRITEHLQKNTNIFLVPSQRYQHFWHIWLNPKF